MGDNADDYTHEILEGNVQTKLNPSVIKYNSDMGDNTDDYTHETLQGFIHTKNTMSKQVLPIEDLIDIDVKTKEILNTSHNTTKTYYTKDGHTYNDIELRSRHLNTSATTNKKSDIFVRNEIEYQKEQERNLPQHNISINKGSSTSADIDPNREYFLRPSINAGEFKGTGFIPTFNTKDNTSEVGANKSSLLKKVTRNKIISDITTNR